SPAGPLRRPHPRRDLETDAGEPLDRNRRELGRPVAPPPLGRARAIRARLVRDGRRGRPRPHRPRPRRPAPPPATSPAALPGAVGSWELSVRDALSLGLARPDEPNRLRSLVRRLMLLGHAQVSPDQQHWCACPLTLVASETERDTVFVCGQQTEAVRRALQQ